METSERIDELAAALAKAQGEFTNPHKNRDVKVRMKAGGEYTFAYATFDAILDVVRKPLADNGLSLIQSLGTDAKGDVVITRLMHASGQWVQFPTPIFCAENGAQAFGSGITYAKRYAITALLVIASDEDDDGNAASGNQATAKDRAPRKSAPPKTEPPADTKNQAREYEAAMSPEEMEQFTKDRNTFCERISKADSLMTLDEIATDLKTSPERIKGVVRPLWLARKKVIQGEQVPPEENP